MTKTSWVSALLMLCVVVPASAVQRATAVYISADMEGVAGLSRTDDSRGKQFMTAEVNAAIAGAFAAGARRVAVNDAHGSHANLIQDALDPRVTLYRGDLKPYGMMQGLDSSYGAVVFIGYHAKAGTPGGHLAHTGSGRVADLRVNGLSVGEGGMNALYAAWYGVPVVFVSGDSHAVAQLREVVPGVAGVAVKTGIWGRAIRSLSPDSAVQEIRRGVEAALKASLPAIPPVSTQYEVELAYTSPIYAEIAQGIPSVRRVGPATVAFSTDRYPQAYRMIRLLYKHLAP